MKGRLMPCRAGRDLTGSGIQSAEPDRGGKGTARSRQCGVGHMVPKCSTYNTN